MFFGGAYGIYLEMNFGVRVLFLVVCVCDFWMLFGGVYA